MSKPKPKPKLEILVPIELPVFRFITPYATMSIYSPTNNPLTPERVLLLLEQAKFELLNRKKI